MATRTLTVKILGDSRQLQREFQRAGKSGVGFNNQLGKISRGALAGSGALGGLARSVAFASTAFLGGAGLTAAITSSVSAASNLQEQIAKTENVFGASTAAVRAFARTSATSLGQAEDQALSTVSSFGALLRPLGVLPAQAANLSQRLTTLGADLASFYNTDVQSALDAIRSGLVGESEPLRRYGVLLSETRVQQVAMAESGKTNAKSLTNQEKAFARYSIILKDAALAQGDFAETSDGLANQQRILQAQLRNVQIQLGTALIPAILDVTRGVTDWLSKTENQERVQREITAAVKTAGEVLSGFVSVMRTLRDILGPVVEDLGGVKNTVKLLLGVLIASKVLKFATAVRLLGTNSTEAATAVGTLRTRLKTLKALGAIGIVITVTLVGKEILDRLSKFAEEHGSTGVGRVATKGGVFEPGGLSRDAAARAAAEARRRRAAAAQEALREKSDIEDMTARARAAAAAAEKLEEAFQSRRRRGGLTATQRNTFFDNDLARQLDRVQDSALRDQIAKLQSIAKRISQRIAATKDITRKLNLEDQLLDVRRRIKSIRETIAGDLKAAAADARASLEAAGEALIESLQFGLTRAQVTASFADDLAALAAIQDGLRQRIRAEGNTLDLQQQLFDVEQQTIEVERQRRNARQFKALGLSATGEERIPGLTALRRQLGNVGEAIKGTFLDTNKTRSLLANIRKVLSGGLGKVSAEVRAKIKEMLDDINQQLKNHGRRTSKFRALDTSKFLEGLDLTPDQRRALRARLAQVGRGGKVPTTGPSAFGIGLAGRTGGGITITGPITVVANDPAAFERDLVKLRRRRATQTTGPFAGNAMGHNG